MFLKLTTESGITHFLCLSDIVGVFVAKKPSRKLLTVIYRNIAEEWIFTVTNPEWTKIEKQLLEYSCLVAKTSARA